MESSREHRGERIRLLGLPVTTAEFEVGQRLAGIRSGASFLTTFINPNACALSRAHDDYPTLLAQFDAILCDGIGMVVAARRLAGADLERYSFDYTSLAKPVFDWAVETDTPLCLVGGRPGVAEAAGRAISSRHAELRLDATFSGYGQDVDDAAAWILERPGCLVVCGMGAPRQERFLLNLRESGWRGAGFTCGGFFDQVSGNGDYYPAWIDRLNLRFLYRLFREPRRLWRRYLVDYQVFLRLYMKQAWSGNT